MKRLIALAVALMLVLGMTVTAEGKPELGGSYYNLNVNLKRTNERGSRDE